MSERMTDERLASYQYIEKMEDEISWFDAVRDRNQLITALKAEREMVAELEQIREVDLTAVAAAHYALIKMEWRAEAAEAKLEAVRGLVYSWQGT